MSIINLEYMGIFNENAIKAISKESELLKEEGEKLAYVLNLKKNKAGLYETTWGNKTEIGLYLTVLGILIN